MRLEVIIVLLLSTRLGVLSTLYLQNWEFYLQDWEWLLYFYLQDWKWSFTKPAVIGEQNYFDSINQPKNGKKEEPVLSQWRFFIFTKKQSIHLGDVKLLQHKITHRIRVLMRRDKTHKICANHYSMNFICIVVSNLTCVLVTPEITLSPNVGSDRSWVYTTAGDFSEGEAKTELLAIRFGNPESKWFLIDLFFVSSLLN